MLRVNPHDLREARRQAMDASIQELQELTIPLSDPAWNPVDEIKDNDVEVKIPPVSDLERLYALVYESSVETEKSGNTWQRTQGRISNKTLQAIQRGYAAQYATKQLEVHSNENIESVGENGQAGMAAGRSGEASLLSVAAGNQGPNLGNATLLLRNSLYHLHNLANTIDRLIPPASTLAIGSAGSSRPGGLSAQGTASNPTALTPNATAGSSTLATAAERTPGPARDRFLSLQGAQMNLHICEAPLTSYTLAHRRMGLDAAVAARLRSDRKEGVAIALLTKSRQLAKSADALLESAAELDERVASSRRFAYDLRKLHSVMPFTLPLALPGGKPAEEALRHEIYMAANRGHTSLGTDPRSVPLSRELSQNAPQHNLDYDILAKGLADPMILTTAQRVPQGFSFASANLCSQVLNQPLPPAGHGVVAQLSLSAQAQPHCFAPNYDRASSLYVNSPSLALPANQPNLSPTDRNVAGVNESLRVGLRRCPAGGLTTQITAALHSWAVRRQLLEQFKQEQLSQQRESQGYGGPVTTSSSTLFAKTSETVAVGDYQPRPDLNPDQLVVPWHSRRWLEVFAPLRDHLQRNLMQTGFLRLYQEATILHMIGKLRTNDIQNILLTPASETSKKARGRSQRSQGQSSRTNEDIDTISALRETPSCAPSTIMCTGLSGSSEALNVTSRLAPNLSCEATTAAVAGGSQPRATIAASFDRLSAPFKLVQSDALDIALQNNVLLFSRIAEKVLSRNILAQRAQMLCSQLKQRQQDGVGSGVLKSGGDMRPEDVFLDRTVLAELLGLSSEGDTGTYPQLSTIPLPVLRAVASSISSIMQCTLLHRKSAITTSLSDSGNEAAPLLALLYPNSAIAAGIASKCTFLRIRLGGSRKLTLLARTQVPGRRRQTEWVAARNDLILSANTYRSKEYPWYPLHVPRSSVATDLESNCQQPLSLSPKCVLPNIFTYHRSRNITQGLLMRRVKIWSAPILLVKRLARLFPYDIARKESIVKRQTDRALAGITAAPAVMAQWKDWMERAVNLALMSLRVRRALNISITATQHSGDVSSEISLKILWNGMPIARLSLVGNVLQVELRKHCEALPTTLYDHEVAFISATIASAVCKAARLAIMNSSTLSVEAVHRIASRVVRGAMASSQHPISQQGLPLRLLDAASANANANAYAGVNGGMVVSSPAQVLTMLENTIEKWVSTSPEDAVSQLERMLAKLIL